MGFMNKYVKKYWKLFLLSVSFLVVEAVGDLLQPTIMANMVDVGVANNDMDYVLRMGGIMLLVTAFGAIGAVGRNIVSSHTSQRFGADLRLDLFKKVQSLSSHSLNKFDTASLITRLTYDITQVKDFVHRMMRIFVKAPILCIGSIIMAVYLSPPMSLVLAIVVPVIGVLIIFNLKIGYPFFRKVQKAMDKLNGVMREHLGGIRVVKAFNRSEYENKRFKGANDHLASVTKKAMRVMAVFSPSITLTVNLGIVAVLWFGGYSVRAGNMEVGKVIAFINYMTQILHSLMVISRVFNNSVRAKASAHRIEEVFTHENTIENKPGALYTSRGTGLVEFCDVSFSYGDTSEPVLENITFSCLPGETVGIIGSTGSGKSTLVNLIPRFYDVGSGNIKINGVDIKDIQTDNLREKIAIVPQKTLLFTGTILDNIKWGKENATDLEVEQAAQIAEAHSFITSFPKGYQTLLGQGGINLSGGQKQRVSIARALIKKPEILIMDDSTSAVDVTTEGKIREGLKKYASTLTCIIIAQRISSVVTADKIVVLDEGKVVGIGKHGELIKQCSVYQDIFRSQIGKEAV